MMDTRGVQMIVYRSTVRGFQDDLLSNRIEQIILDQLKIKLKRSVGASEMASWKNSLQAVGQVLQQAIQPSVGVGIEFILSPTSKRIDLLLSGSTVDGSPKAVLVELKQWTEVELTEMDGIVKSFVGGAVRELTHPSYQAWSYAMMLRDFNEAVELVPIEIIPCAYLHNCISDAAVRDPRYQDVIDDAPVFTQRDGLALRSFISQEIPVGDSGLVLDQLDGARTRPSKALADCLETMLQGNQAFTLLDDQKIVYEAALTASLVATDNQKQVVIIEGGPGTGKSVVAINLLVNGTVRGLASQYVTKNAAPRAVYAEMLSRSFRKRRIEELFIGSGSFTEAPNNMWDLLVVDEAHRLMRKSGMYQNLGENQVMELIRAAKTSVFFVDEDQRIAFSDIGSKDEIRKWAKLLGARVSHYKLESQFRCNGSDGYLAWLDDMLDIRETANPDLTGIDYDFRVCDNPSELREQIERCNATNRARMVAGYCWKWPSKKDPTAMDIVFPEYGFEAQWNLGIDGSLWMIKPDSVKQIGCIHTCQGLEMEYVGVIFGKDFIVRDGIVQTDALARASSDKSVHGYKSRFRENPDEARKAADLVIKNTYRTLMSRGQKGCFVWSVDPETNEYFKLRSVRSD